MPTFVSALRNAAVTLVLSVGSLLLSTGCGGAGPAESGMTDTLASSGTTTKPTLPSATELAGQATGCAQAAEGCSCAVEGATTSCPGPKVRSGNYTSCAPGLRECIGGVWGPCQANAVVANVDQVAQDFSGRCVEGTRLDWGAFSFDGVIPGDARVDVSVQTADLQAGLDGAPSVPIAELRAAADATWATPDVSAALARAGLTSGRWLRVTLTLTPATRGGASPSIAEWRQASSCDPN